jgi:hypothetical protein
MTENQMANSVLQNIYLSFSHPSFRMKYFTRIHKPKYNNASEIWVFNAVKINEFTICETCGG